MCLKNITNHRLRSFAEFMANEDQRSHEQYKDKKIILFKNISGSILELGPGTGINFQYFRRDIQWTGIEPNEMMHPYIKRKAEEFGIKHQLLTDSAEQLSARDESYDYVISTIVLCSVNDVQKTLEEIKRVLKPGGKFIFLEHQADKKWTSRWFVQKTVPYTPWRYFSDGCTPGRQLEKLISNAGFSSSHINNYYQQGEGWIIKINSPHIYGWAQK